jgi:hypothetical protein
MKGLFCNARAYTGRGENSQISIFYFLTLVSVLEKIYNLRFDKADCHELAVCSGFHQLLLEMMLEIMPLAH